MLTHFLCVTSFDQLQKKSAQEGYDVVTVQKLIGLTFIKQVGPTCRMTPTLLTQHEPSAYTVQSVPLERPNTRTTDSAVVSRPSIRHTQSTGGTLLLVF